MKVFKKKSVGCSKKFAAKAAMYRRLAKGMGSTLTFTREDLIELYMYESTGKGGKSAFESMRQRNGFALGKWLRDIDTAQYIEDLRNGMINPKELLEGVGIVHNKGFEIHFNWEEDKKNWIDPVSYECLDYISIENGIESYKARKILSAAGNDGQSIKYILTDKSEVVVDLNSLKDKNE